MKSSLPIHARNLLCLLIFFLILSGNASAQFGKLKIDAGLNFGPTFFLGDLGGHQGKGSTFIKDVNIPLTKIMKGAYVSIYPSDWIGLRIAAQLTYVAGDDAIINTKGIDESWRKQRNLDFRSNMWEAYGAIEIMPTMLFKKYDDYEPLITPYGFIGLGIFHFDPEGSLTDANGVKTWYKLHPLMTEGQGMKEYPNKKAYQLTQLNIPMGGGLKIAVTKRLVTAVELLYRKTFTDYIDDLSTTYIDQKYFANYLSSSDAAIARRISDKTVGIVTPGVTRYAPGVQRGNEKNNDAYFSFVFKLGVKLGQVGTAEEKNVKNQRRCPLLY